MKGRGHDPIRFPWDNEESNIVLIKLAFISIRREIEAALRPTGLTPQQSQSLHMLSLSPGLTNADLEKLLFIDKSSVTSLINGMEKKGLVIRREHAQDARVKLIYLTDKGKETHVLTSTAVQQAKERFNETLSPEEAEMLNTLLKKALKAFE